MWMALNLGDESFFVDVVKWHGGFEISAGKLFCFSIYTFFFSQTFKFMWNGSNWPESDDTLPDGLVALKFSEQWFLWIFILQFETKIYQIYWKIYKFKYV